MRGVKFWVVGVCALLLGLGVAGLLRSEMPALPAQLADLQAGNARFLAGASTRAPVTPERLRELAKGQHPRAVVVACADSRVAPELVFDQGLGEIFVVRTAGNVVDVVALASIEYGVEHLHAPLLVVMGHQYCGAVQAALFHTGEAAGHAPGAPRDHLGTLLAHIAPAVATARAVKGVTDAARLEIAIQANVRNVARQIQRQSPVVAQAVKAGKLRVISMEYSLDSGKVQLLPADRPAGH